MYMVRLLGATGAWCEVPLGADRQKALEVGRQLAAICEGIRLGIPTPLQGPAVPAVYFAATKRSGQVLVKIGYSRNVTARVRELQTGGAASIGLVAWRPGGAKEEREEHLRWRTFRTVGEWFRLEGELKTYVTAIREALATT